MQGLEALPPWAQVVLSILAFLAATWAWLRGMFKNLPEKGKDVVVPSVTAADGAAIERMTDTLREANRVAREHREHDTEMLYTLIAIKESNQRIEHLLGRMLDQMRGR